MRTLVAPASIKLEVTPLKKIVSHVLFSPTDTLTHLDTAHAEIFCKRKFVRNFCNRKQCDVRSTTSKKPPTKITAASTAPFSFTTRLEARPIVSLVMLVTLAQALIFAVFLTNPAPICVLDEVDAPLDDHNVDRFCDLLDEMTRLTDTRFVIITHNPITMARMNRLYGVTMAERGVSQLVSVDLETAAKLRDAA